MSHNWNRREVLQSLTMGAFVGKPLRALAAQAALPPAQSRD